MNRKRTHGKIKPKGAWCKILMKLIWGEVGFLDKNIVFNVHHVIEGRRRGRLLWKEVGEYQLGLLTDPVWVWIHMCWLPSYLFICIRNGSDINGSGLSMDPHMSIPLIICLFASSTDRIWAYMFRPIYEKLYFQITDRIRTYMFRPVYE